MSRKPHLEVVTWLDHVGDYGDNINTTKVQLKQRKSVGWVVRETKHIVVLAHTDDGGGYADCTGIGVALITRRRRVT